MCVLVAVELVTLVVQESVIQLVLIVVFRIVVQVAKVRVQDIVIPIVTHNVKVRVLFVQEVANLGVLVARIIAILRVKVVV